MSLENKKVSEISEMTIKKIYVKNSITSGALVPFHSAGSALVFTDLARVVFFLFFILVHISGVKKTHRLHTEGWKKGKKSALIVW